MGVFGGAISVRSPKYSISNDPPLLVLKENTYDIQSSYLSGSSIHFRAVKQDEGQWCGGVSAEKEKYTMHHGYKIHNGGAATYICKVVNESHPDYDTYGSPSGELTLDTNQYNFTLLSDPAQNITI